MKTRKEYWAARDKLRRDCAKRLMEGLEQLKRDFEDMVVDLIVNRQRVSYDVLAERIGINKSEVAKLAKKHNCQRPRGASAPAFRASIKRNQ